MKDIQPIFEWALQNGDVKVIDRICIKLLPVMLENNIQLTEALIKNCDSIDVADTLYDEVLKMAVSLVGKPYDTHQEAEYV
ncbi:hypothetical protein J9253_15285 [Thiothrix litoralis]|jgi:hypothetical protein|uniref:Uncharacterized protein n=1 Tax=Thiothrix litoralis TaxID=2891210 RepID=A0ABX7WNI0_9GAMM|nr:hypothetical protein [Thiothrix litoralis]QTR45356.1 hypothetical protein J9253_15285 [Thiothrix litoralis]